MHAYRLDPALKSLGKRLDSILWDIARLPLSPPIDELLKQLELVEVRATAKRDLECHPWVEPRARTKPAKCWWSRGKSKP